ncbi:MAG: sulfatase-like hydrolase/transferase [Myxococcota bacterium]|nr:sulfatase-like hydrolase/transferase [Myxococcota bacterium]
MRRTLAWGIAGGIGGLVVGLVEVLVLVLFASGMFFDAQELAVTALFTVGISIGAGCCCFLLLASARAGFNWVRRRCALASWQRISLCAAQFFPLVCYVLWQLTKGPQASQVPGRTGWVIGLSLVSAIVGAWTADRLPQWLADHPGQQRWVALTSGLLAAACYYVDLVVLVRLYPIFHASLTIFTYLFSGLGVAMAWRIDRERIPFSWLISPVVIGVMLACFCIFSVMGTQNPRFVMGERTAAVADILALAQRIAPSESNIPLEATPISPTAVLTEEVHGPRITRPASNIILLSVDAMRWDRLALFGANPQIAPTLNRLATQSVVFSRAYTPIPHTSYAISSLLTGKFTHALAQLPGATEIHETWPQVLHRFRYETAGFFTRAIFFIDRHRFAPYERSGFGFKHHKVDYRVPADARADQLIAYLETARTGKSPIFAWAHFFDPHEPYDETCTRFGPTDEDRYNCEIWRVDQAIGRVLAYLDDAFPNALLTVFADHGEEFEDHGGQFHGTSLYDEQVRVPLLMRIPGVSHRIIETPVSLVDLMGTHLAILDIPIPARCRSKDLTGLIAGTTKDGEAFAQAHGANMIATRAFKLICQHGLDLCQLYDLEKDPKEQRSVAVAHPDLTQALKQRLRNWRHSHAKFELRPVTGTSEADQRWPKAVRDAIAGEPAAIPSLIALIQQDERSTVRRKAAQLLARLWESVDTGSIPRIEADEDPEVAAWIAVLRVRLGDHAATKDLKALMEQLNSGSDAWQAAALARFEAGDRKALKQVLAVSTQADAPIEERRRAIRLLGQSARTRIVPRLIDLIDNYQLTLDIAEALAHLGDRRATQPLIARLKRERFKERKAAIIQALAEIGDRQAAPHIAAVLGLDDPPEGALEALARVTWSRENRFDIGATHSGRQAVVWTRPLPPLLTPGLATIDRIVISVSDPKARGRVHIACNGEEIATASLTPGKREVRAEIVASPWYPKHAKTRCRIAIESETSDAQLAAIAMVGSVQIKRRLERQTPTNTHVED